MTAACLFLFAGEGQYGKVYTCISVDTGELMAMKEVSGLAVREPCAEPLCDGGLVKKLVFMRSLVCRASFGPSTVSPARGCFLVFMLLGPARQIHGVTQDKGVYYPVRVRPGTQIMPTAHRCGKCHTEEKSDESLEGGDNGGILQGVFWGRR